MIELKGKPVAKTIMDAASERVQVLAASHITPTLALVRLGNNPGDAWYAESACKRLSSIGCSVEVYHLSANTTSQELIQLLDDLAHNQAVHAILLLQPLPQGIDAAEVVAHIPPEKDVDGSAPLSQARLYAGHKPAFAPCTAAAVMHLLTFHGYEFQGARAVVLGRSLVVGKPVALLLLSRNATVSVAHSKTLELADLCRSADLIVSAMGRPHMITQDFVGDHTWFVDCATAEDAEGNLVGDASPEIASLVAAYSPVPGGVGPITVAVLADHVVAAAEAAHLASFGKNK